MMYPLYEKFDQDVQQLRTRIQFQPAHVQLASELQNQFQSVGDESHALTSVKSEDVAEAPCPGKSRRCLEISFVLHIQ